MQSYALARAKGPNQSLACSGQRLWAVSQSVASFTPAILVQTKVQSQKSHNKRINLLGNIIILTILVTSLQQCVVLND